MKKLFPFLALAAFTVSSICAAPDADAAAAAARETVEKTGPAVSISNTKGIKLYLVGDSTVCPFNDPYYYPRFGYGTKLNEYLNTDKLEIINLALSGRSSLSFTTEENYKVLVQNIKKGDFLVIGFGHNDEKTEAARYTNPNGSTDTKGSFKNSLYENYIKIALQKGATPILCTPIVRRSPTGSYTGSVLHQTTDVPGFPGGDYSKAIRELGAEKKVTVIDLTEATKALEEKLTPAGSLKLHAWLSHKPDSVDNTHLNTYGASYVAYLFADSLSHTKNKLAKYVKKNIVPPQETILVKNPDYVMPKYETPSDSDISAFWKTTNGWKGTVFGDCGGQEKIDPAKGVFAIDEKDSHVILRSGIPSEGTSVGKISSSSDGIAFYFKQIPIHTDFTFSADAVIKGIASNNQVSFGLMVRDDVYFDKFDNSVKSDYIACGPLKIAAGAGSWQSSFTRTASSLNGTNAAVEPVPAASQTIHLSIVKTGNTYTVTYGKEAPVTYTASLADVDASYIFAGLYTSRCCEIDFSNIVLTTK